MRIISFDISLGSWILRYFYFLLILIQKANSDCYDMFLILGFFTWHCSFTGIFSLCKQQLLHLGLAGAVEWFCFDVVALL